MQVARCLKFFHQCPPKAAALFRCFWSKQDLAASPQHGRISQLYFCTRSLLTDRERIGATEEDVRRENEPEAPVQAVDTSRDANLDYFSSLVSNATLSTVDPEETAVEKRLHAKSADLKNLKPNLPKRSANLAVYVNESETLTRLVQLGTDLSVVEQRPEVANHLLQVDFESGIQPYLEFLLRAGVSENDLGQILTKNAGLLMEDMDDLEVRINYLKSKKFEDSAIARIVCKAPLFLSHTTKHTDTQLGFVQKLFFLKGQEVRQVITAYPKLTTWPKGLIEDVHFVMKEFLGFTDSEQKQLLLFQPKIYTSGRKQLETKFDYLHNTMGLSHTEICIWPQIFRTRLFIIRQRHQFLESIGRAQYNPKKENFVSLKALVSGRDAEFSANIAKVPVSQFNAFLKSM